MLISQQRNLADQCLRKKRYTYFGYIINLFNIVSFVCLLILHVNLHFYLWPVLGFMLYHVYAIT